MYTKEHTLKSAHLQRFIKEIQEENRNPSDARILELLDEIETNPERVIRPGKKVYRCRIVQDERDLGKEPGFYGFDAKASFIAPARYTRDMRANYRYIPYLYCAKHPYTALVEVRPRIGSLVSVATIEAQEEIRLLDLTIQTKPKRMSRAKENLFSDLSYMFSKPVAFEDDTMDYIPTQYIAEYVKKLGYDGIAYESSLVAEIHDKAYQNIFHDDRYNIVIFKYKKCYPIKSNVVRVDRQYTGSIQVDEDTEKIEVQTTLVDVLSSI